MLESKRKAIIFIVLSLLLALTAGFLVLKKVQALNTNLGTTVQVYVASDEISSRSIITPNNVKTEEIPKKYLKKYHVTEVKDLAGKVSVVPLSEGDIITKNILKDVSAVVEENNRLITLMKSERVFFDQRLEALDRVDIIVSHRFNDKEETSIFMKDVKVAMVAKKDNDFQGVQLEVPLDKAPELIHMQNYADSLRIIKANVEKKEEQEKASKKEAEPAKEETPAPKKEEKPKQEPAKKPAEEKPKEKPAEKPAEKPKE
ncbi:pilus assembly protein CpaB [Bacillus pakistanensis]|uniref:Pilus assembly protein CpaB n=1 Tax=Rossellomorea pakistanensis TaxID=992288 RepID=A0ABS2NK92_9BACI|nr:flagella basal body P-ring formation protein FlgA [Bacillus pakistanensis]MBM7588254.1 pilus assembly protein CpaB [Bacillus pakistanensis]